MSIPMVILSVLAIGGGWIDIPHFLAPLTPGQHPPPIQWMPELIVGVLTILGILLSYLLFLRLGHHETRARAFRFFAGGLGFDRVYDLLFVRPFVWLARVLRRDLLDAIYRGLETLANLGYRALSASQSGVLTWYAVGSVIGAVVLVGTALLVALVAP
jgi:NADH-quinone oxidoreductase subunit L